MESPNVCWRDKIQELNVALGQYRRLAFSQIPTVTLAVHPVFEKAVQGGKSTTDFEVPSLAEKLQDDEFLNQVQSGVSKWIEQIRKVTVLPSTTPFLLSNRPWRPIWKKCPFGLSSKMLFNLFKQNCRNAANLLGYHCLGQ